MRDRFSAKIRPRARAAAGFAILVAASATRCRREPAEEPSRESLLAAETQELRRSSLLFVTLDTTRRDVLGFAAQAPFVPARTPALDGFAATAVDFRRAWTVAPLTLPAHASLFTGLYPALHGVRDNLGFRLPDAARTMAERLAQIGFATAAVFAAPVVGPESGIGQGFASFEGPSREDGVDEWPAPKVTNAAIARLGKFAASSQPFFLWVHYFDAHAPHESRAPATERLARRASSRAGDAEAYREEIERIDRNFGRLLAAARAASGARPLFVVVAADHGEALGEHGEATHGHLLHEATMRVPLLMQHPSLTPGPCDAVASLVDVAPTLAEVFGLGGAGDAVQGRSLLPCLLETEQRGAGDERVVFLESRLPWHEFGWAWLDGATDGRFKRVDRPHAELFDLDADPRETRDVAASCTARVRALDGARREFERVCAAATPASRGEGASVLTQLGYVAARTELPRDKAELAEPGDRFALIDLRDRGLEEMARGHYEEAIEAFDALRKQNPDPAPGTLLVAVARSRQAEGLGEGVGRTAALELAEAAWRAAVELCPSEANRRFNLAQTLFELGHDLEAIAELERVVALAPEDAMARRALDEARAARAATHEQGGGERRH